MFSLLPDKDFYIRGEALGTLLAEPFKRFASTQMSGGIAMITMAVLALVTVNSLWGDLYEKLLHTQVAMGIGGALFERSIHFWINEGLMTFFFFVVGLEIKRELLVGELSTRGHAMLPAAGAVGGMLVPAAIYCLFNCNTPSAAGWGIPMATDIAFVLGALAIVGARVPAFLPVFLVSLAIFDDLGAVVVIALFYSGKLEPHFLALAAVVLGALAATNILGFRRALPYLVLGAMLWVLVYLSGIHATVAGVLVALTIPARSRWDTYTFVERVGRAVRKFKAGGERHYVLHLDEENLEAVRSLAKATERVEPPLHRIEHVLHPWVIFLIMPLFAFANSGVRVDTSALLETFSSSESLGIMLGLFVGKQLGVVGAVWLVLRVGGARLPEGVRMAHILGGAVLCGIGFTMSLFIADLSFAESDLQEKAKISILLASVLAGAVGIVMLRRSCGKGQLCAGPENP